MRPCSEGRIINLFPGCPEEALSHYPSTTRPQINSFFASPRRELLWISHFTADSWDAIRDVRNIFVMEAASSQAGSLAEWNTTSSHLEKPDFSSLSKISVSEPRTEHSSALQHLFSWLCSFNSLDNMARVQQLPSVNKPDPSPKQVYDVHQLRWELRTITSDQIFNTSRLDITSQILRLEQKNFSCLETFLTGQEMPDPALWRNKPIELGKKGRS